MGSIPYLYSSVLSTNTLSLSHHGSPSTRVSSASSGPVLSGPKKRATSSRTRDWLRSWPRDNTYYTTRRQYLRPATPGSSLSSNITSFPLLSSWANPSSVVLLQCGSSPFKFKSFSIKFRIWNNSLSSDVLYIQASISPKYESK